MLAGEVIVKFPKELRREVKSTICSENNKNQPRALAALFPQSMNYSPACNENRNDVFIALTEECVEEEHVCS